MPKFFKKRDLVSKYAAIAAYAHMNENEMQAFAGNSLFGTMLTIDSVKNLTIGSRIHSADSSYIQSPVFDVLRLNEDGKLDINNHSGTKASTSLNLSTSKYATSHSEQQKLDFKASSSGMGWKASVAYHQENASQGASFDGNATVELAYNQTGAYIEILPGGFEHAYDFSKYLLGRVLRAEQIKEYVDYEESYVSGSSGDRYISRLLIPRGGQLADKSEIYANIQLLSAMEMVYYIMGNQYSKYEGYPTVRNFIVENMRSLKQYISSAIMDFYQYNGDSFVSFVSLMNCGRGKGVMSLKDSSLNEQAVYAGSISVGYSGLIAGGGMSSSVGIAKQYGWANALKNANVTAEAEPATAIDTKAWVSDIYQMLKSESGPISVPPLTLPTIPSVEVPTPIEPRKSPEEPPPSCFHTYAEWKKYRDGHNAENGQDGKLARQAKENLEAAGVVKMLEPEQANGKLYKAFTRDLVKLKRTRKMLLEGASNPMLIRISDMFVSGFRTTRYDEVLPQLRPNLDLPGQKATFIGFPNLSKMLIAIDHLGRLNSYLRFLSNCPISRVSADVSAAYSRFFEAYSDSASDLIRIKLSQGVDLGDAELAQFTASAFGPSGGSPAKSLLYISLDKNIDLYNYIVKVLLSPGNARIWSEAPGGYLPIGWDTQGLPAFYGLTKIIQNKSTGEDYSVHEMLPLNSSKNPLTLYGETKDYFKSPWFPIFQYNQKEGSTLLFMEMASSYQFIHGYKVTAFPAFSTEFAIDCLWTKNINITEDLVKLVKDKDNSYLTNGAMNWDYSLYFKEATLTPELFEKFQLLTLSIPSSGSDPGPESITKGGYKTRATRLVNKDSLKAWNDAPGRLVCKLGADGNPKAVDLKNEPDFAQSCGAIMLLPLNSTTCGSLFNDAFSYAACLNPSEIVMEGTYETSYCSAILKY